MAGLLGAARRHPRRSGTCRHGMDLKVKGKVIVKALEFLQTLTMHQVHLALGRRVSGDHQSFEFPKAIFKDLEIFQMVPPKDLLGHMRPLTSTVRKVRIKKSASSPSVMRS